MDPQKLSIRALPAEVVAQIKSSTVITHLSGVVLELLKNSLDAGSQRITATMDFQKGGCIVEDDGCGILQREFQEGGGLGQLHHTSKFGCGSDVYGQKGTFLASLAAVALVTITSRHPSCHTTNSLVLHHSKAIARLVPAPPQHELNSARYGTRVSVTDLFGNMPVRVKHRATALQRPEDLDREWEDLKKKVTGLLLAAQRPVKVTMSDARGARKLVTRGGNRPPSPEQTKTGSNFDLSQVLATLSQVGYITPDDFGSWVVASARTAEISVQSAVSLQPSPTRQVQFLSFGILPLDSTSSNLLVSEINRIFAQSHFGEDDYISILETETSAGPDRASPETILEKSLDKRPMSRNKNVNRWPMFVVRIDVKHPSLDPNDDPLGSGNILQRVLDIVCAMFRSFLERHQLSRRRQPAAGRTSRVMSRPSEASARGHPVISPGRVTPLTNTNRSLNGKSVQAAAENLLGPSVPLPATRPRAVIQLRDSFGSWTRIKSARTDFFDDICSGLPRGRKVVGDHTNTHPSRSRSADSIPLEIDAAPDEISPTIPPDDTPECQHCSENACAHCEPADEIIRWMNPVTKEIVRVNKRTGQTIPSARRDVSREAQPAMAPRFSIRKPSVMAEAPGETPKTRAWLDSVLQEWVNPVFPQRECPLPAVSSGFSRDFWELGFDSSFISFDGRLTKEALHDARVISQVDAKFLLITMPIKTGGSVISDVLVLVDQHAADERSRVEQLFQQLCGDPESLTVETTPLTQPISFRVSAQEARLFEELSGYFTSWGCVFNLARDAKTRHTVQISALPTLVAERCRMEPKLAIEMMRAELWSRHDDGRKIPSTQTQLATQETSRSLTAASETTSPSGKNWLNHIGNCPKGIIDLLNSRACRTAIMFNDVLSLDDCVALLSRLAQCAFPFQCAHGRPTMVPIVNVQSQDILEVPPPLSGICGRSGDRTYPSQSNRPVDFMEAFESWRSGHSEG